MSTSALNGLRDYLIGTLSTDNMLWLATQLTDYAKKQDFPLHRYTKEEINAMLEQAVRDFEEGRYIDDEDAWDELEEMERKESEVEMATAV